MNIRLGLVASGLVLKEPCLVFFASRLTAFVQKIQHKYVRVNMSVGIEFWYNFSIKYYGKRRTKKE